MTPLHPYSIPLHPDRFTVKIRDTPFSEAGNLLRARRCHLRAPQMLCARVCPRWLSRALPFPCKEHPYSWGCNCMTLSFCFTDRQPKHCQFMLERYTEGDQRGAELPIYFCLGLRSEKRPLASPSSSRLYILLSGG